MHTPGRAPSLFWSVLVGSLLVQLAWVLAVPAFRGSDEFDHVVKADATAHGQLMGTEPPAQGRGELMRVRDDVAEALGPVCESYTYTGPDNCNPVARHGDGTVDIASAASSYNPAYYVVAGVVALPFPGAWADYAMRAVTALLSAILLAWAAVVTRAWAQGTWPGLALVVAITPVVAYSTTVAAPNGVGMAGGVLMWAAIAGLASSRTPPPLAALCVGAGAVAVTHTTGLLWVPLCLATAVLLRPLSWWRDRLRHHRRAATVSAVAVAAAVVYGAAWVRLAGTNALAPPAEDLPPLRAGDLVVQLVAWVLQTVAAFPLRNQYAPVAVYPMWVLVFGGLLALGLRAGRARGRAVLVLLVTLWLVVAVVLTVVSYASEPFAWQGRYAMPLAVGLTTVAGYCLSASGRTPTWRSTFVVLLLTGAAHVLSVAQVTRREANLGLSPTFADVVPGPPVVAAVVVGAVATLGFVVAVTGWRSAERRSPDVAENVPSGTAGRVSG